MEGRKPLTLPRQRVQCHGVGYGLEKATWLCDGLNELGGKDKEAEGAKYDLGFLWLKHLEKEIGGLLRALEKRQNGSGIGAQKFSFGHVQIDIAV